MTESSTDLTTHTGFKFHVRPVQPEDEAALGRFFEQVTPEDLRFRFLSSQKRVGHDQLLAMTRVDHRRTESFLAIAGNGGPIIASAMLACDENLDVGEVAISVSADHRNMGLGWELLGHITRYAEAKGVRLLQSLESRSNHSAIQLEKEFGFTTQSYPDDPALVMVQKILRPSL
ncbi:GNAT superfamily N-acetyltransferase [Devosia sp. UYZn731]|uniref:GNAT family N-acetyltransferase n=1 Tax=Devosia sp. UYZn731 TaxID=3156345 RepID=UPI003399FB00